LRNLRVRFVELAQWQMPLGNQHVSSARLGLSLRAQGERPVMHVNQVCAGCDSLETSHA